MICVMFVAMVICKTDTDKEAVRFGYGLGMVRAVPVFGSLVCKKGLSVFQYSSTGKDASGLRLEKGFCRTKFRAKFAFWRGAVRGEVFAKVWGEVFAEVFGEVLLGQAEQKNVIKNFSPKIPTTLQSKLAKIQENSHDEVLQGHPCQGCGSWKTVPAVPLRFREKRFQWFRFPVPFWFLSHPAMTLNIAGITCGIDYLALYSMKCLRELSNVM